MNEEIEAKIIEKKISKYIILEGNKDKVMEMVNENLQQGFLLYGNLTSTMDDYRNIKYGQVMIKYSN